MIQERAKPGQRDTSDLTPVTIGHAEVVLVPVRGPNGILGEDGIPVESWENPDARQVAPFDVMEIMGASTPIIRVSHDVLAKQMRRHSKVEKPYWNDLTQTLTKWDSWRKQRPGESKSSTRERWEFNQYIDDGTIEGGWPLLTTLELLPDGSINLITSHRRQANDWESLWRARGGIVWRDDE
jgi:hypothetical protein